jgi:hypothetical protein
VAADVEAASPGEALLKIRIHISDFGFSKVLSASRSCLANSVIELPIEGKRNKNEGKYIFKCDDIER